MLLTQLEAAVMPWEEPMRYRYLGASKMLPWKLMTQKGKKSSMSAVPEYPQKHSLFLEAHSPLPQCPTGTAAAVVTPDTPTGTGDVAAPESSDLGINTAPAKTASGNQEEVGPAFPWQVYASQRSQLRQVPGPMSSSFDIHSACQNESVSRRQQRCGVSEQRPLACGHCWIWKHSGWVRL